MLFFCCFFSTQNSEGVIATALMYADVVWDREPSDEDELSFRVGDVIEILDMTDDVWWQGSVVDSTGWFPSSFVRVSTNSMVHGTGRLFCGSCLSRGSVLVLTSLDQFSLLHKICALFIYLL